MRLVSKIALALSLVASLAAGAQTSMPPNQTSPVRDASTLKPPTGAKVAVVVYEDLECPFCSRAFPIVHAAARAHHIPVQEYDFQVPSHQWSHEAATFAHYLQAKVSSQCAEDYRRYIFASQFRISSREDLRHCTQLFMAQQKKPLPFVVDPTGAFSREIDASTAQAVKMGLGHTPSIFVVTQDHWIEIADLNQIDAAIEHAQTEATRHPANSKTQTVN